MKRDSFLTVVVVVGLRVDVESFTQIPQHRPHRPHRQRQQQHKYWKRRPTNHQAGCRARQGSMLSSVAGVVGGDSEGLGQPLLPSGNDNGEERQQEEEAEEDNGRDEGSKGQVNDMNARAMRVELQRRGVKHADIFEREELRRRVREARAGMYAKGRQGMGAVGAYGPQEEKSGDGACACMHGARTPSVSPSLDRGLCVIS